jgi:hypothetical protein
MSSAERTLFIQTYRAISTPGHPEYSQYQNLVARHAANFGPIHTSQNFLPWHRWFSMEMENLLQNVDCRVTIPWWDSAKNAGSPWGVSPWGAAADLMGTSGACVSDGGFAGWTPNAHGCLSRTNTGTLPTSIQESNVLAMSSGNFIAFSDALEGQIHNIPHTRIGGTMMQGWSPEAPEFFLHHNHIDKLWDDWQKKSSAHLNAYSPTFSLTTPMPVAYGATPGQYNNLKATKVIYVRYSPNAQGSGHFYLPACSLIIVSVNFAVDINALQRNISLASPSVLRTIPQLAAPILTEKEEEMMIDNVRKGRGTQAHIDAFKRRLAQAKQAATRFNQALTDAKTLRESFEKPIDQALGFDVATAVRVLKVPAAVQDDQTSQLTRG